MLTSETIFSDKSKEKKSTLIALANKCQKLFQLVNTLNPVNASFLLTLVCNAESECEKIIKVLEREKQTDPILLKL